MRGKLWRNKWASSTSINQTSGSLVILPLDPYDKRSMSMGKSKHINCSSLRLNYQNWWCCLGFPLKTNKLAPKKTHTHWGSCLLASLKRLRQSTPKCVRFRLLLTMISYPIAKYVTQPKEGAHGQEQRQLQQSQILTSVPPCYKEQSNKQCTNSDKPMSGG